jgi:hypothetical protein
MFDSDIYYIQDFKESTLSLFIIDNKLILESGNIKLISVNIYSIAGNGNELECLYSDIDTEYSFSENGTYKIKIQGVYIINGIIKKYKYDSIFNINNICYICYNSGSDCYHSEHPTERFHHSCMIRCSHCPLCRSNILSHTAQYSKIENEILIYYKKAKVYYNEDFNINVKYLLKNFLKINSYNITTNDNVIKVHLSNENNIFYMNDVYVPIILPRGYKYDASYIMLETMEKIISPRDKFIRGFKYLEEEYNRIVYKNPEEILSSIIPTYYNNYKVWVKIIFTDEYNDNIDTYILLSTDAMCPGLVVKTSMITNMNLINKNIVSLCCFPKPYWKNNIIRPILSDDIECYKDFIKEANV